MSYNPTSLSLTSAIGVNSDIVISGSNWVGNVYTGLGEQNDYNYASVNLQVDEAGILTFQFSQDGTNWSSFPTTQFTIASGINEVHGAWKGTRYVRPYFSGATGTRTYFRLRTMYSYEPVQLSAPINQSINSDADATIVRSIGIGENPTSSFVNQKIDGEAFKTTTLLGANSGYTSNLILTDGYTQIETRLYSDQSGMLVGKWYSDVNKTQLVRTFTRPYAGTELSATSYFSSPMFADYVEYTYTNGSTPQTQFNLELHLTTKSISGQLLGINDFIPSGVVANLGRNVVVGQDVAGNFRNVGVDSEGHMRVNMDEPLTAFGEMSVAEPTPVAQLDFVYGINQQLVATATTNGGTFISLDGNAIVSTSATTGSTAILSSRRYAKYRDGQGTVGRMTGIFESGITGNNQYVGVGTPDLSDGYFFAKSGTTFGIIHKSSGTTIDFIPQTSWNEDTMDGSGNEANPSNELLVPTNGNVYQIKLQYLGYGNIFFYIETNGSGELTNVHNIKYANAYTNTSLRQPSLSLVWASENTTNNTSISVKGASGALFTEGKVSYLGPQYGIDNNKSINAGTSTNIITLKNATTYNGIVNRAQVRVKTISLACDTGTSNSGVQVLQVHKNANLNTSSFVAINGTLSDSGGTITNGNSVVSYDTTGTTVTTTPTSYIIFNTNVSRNSNVVVDVSTLDIYINPSETLTFLIKTIGGGSGQVANVSVNWTEDI